MSERKDGGPAFWASSLTVRDWFAGHIVAAKLVQRGLHYHGSEAEIAECVRQTCESASRVADAMLVERAKAQFQEAAE